MKLRLTLALIAMATGLDGCQSAHGAMTVALPGVTINDAQIVHSLSTIAEIGGADADRGPGEVINVTIQNQSSQPLPNQPKDYKLIGSQGESVSVDPLYDQQLNSPGGFFSTIPAHGTDTGWIAFHIPRIGDPTYTLQFGTGPVTIQIHVKNRPDLTPEPQPSPQRPVYLSLTKTDRQTLQDFQGLLDYATANGELTTMNATVKDELATNPGGIDPNHEPIRWYIDKLDDPRTLQSVGSPAFGKDMANARKLYEIARTQNSVQALNELDKLVRELNFAAQNVNGQYYGMSCIEGHGEITDRFIALFSPSH